MRTVLGVQGTMRTSVLRIVALAVLLFLILTSILVLTTMQRMPDTIIYLVDSRPTSFRLEPVGRQLGTEDPEVLARQLVSELAQGPTEAEDSRGLTSVIPAQVQVLDASLSDGILTIDLSGDFAEGGGSAMMQGRLYQLLYTLTQSTEVDGVVLMVEGERVETFSGEGIMLDSPWMRADHPALPVW